MSCLLRSLGEFPLAPFFFAMKVLYVWGCLWFINRQIFCELGIVLFGVYQCASESRNLAYLVVCLMMFAVDLILERQ